MNDDRSPSGTASHENAATDAFMDTSTRRLVDLTLNAAYDSLPDSVVHECKRRLIDTLGCAVGAFHDPLCATIREMAREYGGPQSATIWGTSFQSSAEMAAFCNGVMLRVHDFNDTYFAADGAHPSDIIAGILAVGEAVGADGRSLLLSIATGYEIFCRLMQSVDVGARNFDQTLYVTVGSVFAVGQLMRLPRHQLGHAASLAIAPHLSLRQTRKGQLSHWKGCAAAEAVRNAIFAANLAARGVTGPSEIFEGKQGLWSVLGHFEWAWQDAWPAMSVVHSTYLKNLAVCYHAQAAAQAAIRLHSEVRGREVDSIHVNAYEEAVRMIGSDASRWAPRSRETADHSLPFIVATCLVNGKVDARSFDDVELIRPQLVDLMAKTRVEACPQLTSMYPKAAPARVTVKTSDGSTFETEVRFPKGHASDPMTDDEVEAKFISLGGSPANLPAIRRALSTLWSIDECGDAAAATLPTLQPLCGQ